MSEKACTKCGVVKPLSDFSVRGKTWRSHCKVCSRAWYAANREALLPYKREYYKTHKEAVKNYPSSRPEHRLAYGKAYREQHKADTARRNRLFKSLNPGYTREWYQKNLEARRKYHRGWCKSKRQTDPKFKLLDNTRRRLRSALDGKTKSKRTIEILGCSVTELKARLESQFVDGMSWGNLGKWEVDHIIPCAAFDLSIEEELCACFNYKNLQPLWAHDNRVKSCKVG